MKLYMRKITDKSNRYPQPVTHELHPVRLPKRKLYVWWVDLLNTSCPLLCTPTAALSTWAPAAMQYSFRDSDLRDSKVYLTSSVGMEGARH